MTAPWAAPTDVEEFTPAASWLIARTPVRKKVWDLLDERAQRKAFTVAGVAQADLIRDVLLALDRAVANGETLEDFKKRVGQQLVDAWAGSVVNPGWRVETIFRTNAQLAYNAGRYQQMTEPALLKVRPYWQFDAILDNRVTLMCEQADGTILPHDHPWWKANYPPRHFNCRSVVRSIRKSQAERKGITETPSTEPSQDGFGLTPDAAEWKPNTKKYPPEIRKELEARLKRLDKRPIQRTPKPERAKPKKSSKPKPEHTIEHWEKQFKPKYGDAARAMAWGRAMQERGMDMSAKKAAKLIQDKGLEGHDAYFGLIVKAAKANPGAKVSDLTLNWQNRPLAAILGHAQTVSAATGTAKVVNDVTDDTVKTAKRWLDKMTGKSLDGKVKIEWHSDRAFCDIDTSPPTLHIPKSVRTIVHEWGHALEKSNPKAWKAAKAFLDARTKGETMRQLSKLIPGVGYKPNEWTKKDQFFSPYCGKIYGYDATELLSMGAEQLFQAPKWFYAQDPEHFWWVLGVLAGA